MLKKNWIHAIRRDEGKDFKIRESTKVCSRHFRKKDLKKTLAGKICLKSGAVPSIFSWIRTSPRKRKPPTERYTCEPVASPSTAPSSSRSDASPESVSRFEMQNLMEVNITSTFSDVEMEAMNSNEFSEMESCDHDLAEAGKNNVSPVKTKESQIWNRKSLT